MDESSRGTRSLPRVDLPPVVAADARAGAPGLPGADAGGARARGAQHQGRRRAGAAPGQTRWDREGPSIINNAYNSFYVAKMQLVLTTKKSSKIYRRFENEYIG